MTPKAPPFPYGQRLPLAAQRVASLRPYDPLRTSAHVHDRYNLELKVASRLPPEEAQALRGAQGAQEAQEAQDAQDAQGAQEAQDAQDAQDAQGALRYHVGLYLFFPLSFGVSADTYPATQLFNDLKTYLRREPPMLWRSADDDTLDPGPLALLERSLTALAASALPQQPEQARWMHFFGCALRRTIRHLASVIDAEAQANPDAWADHQWQRALTRFEVRLRSLCDLLGRFRAIREQLRLLPDIVHPAYDEAALVADEMASYLLESVLADMDVTLQRLLIDGDWSGRLLDQAARVRRDLVMTARTEMSYRLRQGFLRHQAATHTREEYFTYRVGQLKKLMDRVLFFDMTQVDAPTPLRHIVGGVGAALAATWAFVAAASTGGMAQNSGTSTFVVFCVAVVAYILKDRIKEVSREKLMGWVRKHRPDRAARFAGDHVQLADQAQLAGEVHESVSFKAPDEVPAVVQAIRDAGHVVAVDERVERTLHYHRRVQYALRGGDPFQFEVKDLLRLNIRPFLDHLDVPDRTVRYFDPASGQFNATTATKVYHLNVVLTYRVLNPNLGERPGDDPGWTTYERLRVILTRHGIERVETVLPRGEHPWLTAGPLQGDGDGWALEPPVPPPGIGSLSPDLGSAPLRPLTPPATPP